MLTAHSSVFALLALHYISLYTYMLAIYFQILHYRSCCLPSAALEESATERRIGSLHSI